MFWPSARRHDYIMYNLQTESTGSYPVLNNSQTTKNWTWTPQADVSLIVNKTSRITKKRRTENKRSFHRVKYRLWCSFPTKTWQSMYLPSKNAILLWYIKRSVSNAVNYTQIQIYGVWLLFVATALQIKAEGRRGERTTQKTKSEKAAASIERPLIWRAQPQFRSTFLDRF